MYCVRWNSHKCVEILLQHIPVNSVTAGGNTALHLACQSHNRETLELLLLHPDIDPDIVNNQVASCLELQTEPSAKFSQALRRPLLGPSSG